MCSRATCFASDSASWACKTMYEESDASKRILPTRVTCNYLTWSHYMLRMSFDWHNSVQHPRNQDTRQPRCQEVASALTLPVHIEGQLPIRGKLQKHLLTCCGECATWSTESSACPSVPDNAAASAALARSSIPRRRRASAIDCWLSCASASRCCSKAVSLPRPALFRQVPCAGWTTQRTMSEQVRLLDPDAGFCKPVTEMDTIEKLCTATADGARAEHMTMQIAGATADGARAEHMAM